MVEGRTKEGLRDGEEFSLHRAEKFFANCCTKSRHATILYLKAQIGRAFPPCSFLTPGAASWNLKDYTEFVLPRCRKSFPDLATRCPVIYYTKASHHLLPAVVRAGSQRAERGLAHSLAKFAKWQARAVALQGISTPPFCLPPRKKFARQLLISPRLSGHGHILNLGTGFAAHAVEQCPWPESRRRYQELPGEFFRGGKQMAGRDSPAGPRAGLPFCELRQAECASPRSATLAPARTTAAEDDAKPWCSR